MGNKCRTELEAFRETNLNPWPLSSMRTSEQVASNPMPRTRSPDVSSTTSATQRHTDVQMSSDDCSKKSAKKRWSYKQSILIVPLACCKGLFSKNNLRQFTCYPKDSLAANWFQGAWLCKVFYRQVFSWCVVIYFAS